MTELAGRPAITVMWPELYSSLSARWLLTLSSSGVRSVVPRKFEAGLVPALPVMLQAPAIPIASQETVPSELTMRMAWPAAHVPVTRRCSAEPSRSSNLSAFRFCTFTCELTESGGVPAVTIDFSPGPPPLFLPTTPAPLGSVEFVSP